MCWNTHHHILTFLPQMRLHCPWILCPSGIRMGLYSCSFSGSKKSLNPLTFHWKMAIANVSCVFRSQNWTKIPSRAFQRVLLTRTISSDGRCSSLDRQIPFSKWTRWPLIDTLYYIRKLCVCVLQWGWLLQGTSTFSKGISAAAAAHEVRDRDLASEHREERRCLHIDTAWAGRWQMGLREGLGALAARTHRRNHTNLCNIHVGGSQRRIAGQCGRCQGMAGIVSRI